FEVAKSLQKPVIIHAQTLKGKGYEKAEGFYERWHGVGPFDIESGKAIGKSEKKSATELYSESLLALADENENVVGITAAMPSGTGIDKLIQAYPERFWDVAIAEQHAVTSMAAMAKEGFKPFVTIYSTFMQRAYDQIIHDVCIMNLNVVFAMDRAGIVGEDGETHQGVFDISFLNAIPNMTLFAPRCASSMKDAIWYAYKHQGPCALRYPRGPFLPCGTKESAPFEYGKGELLEEGKDIAFIGYGQGVGRAWQTKQLLKDRHKPALVDLRFVKPLDGKMLTHLAKKYKKWVIFSDSARSGGVGEILTVWLQDNGYKNINIVHTEFPDLFIPHGKTPDIENFLGIAPKKIAEAFEKDN
ncbi:MAG: 1-deoxy-D-xylulose-5-phosphate synthase, partial [Campylobacteraceae bacterium]|nr:1-deoxy-D-xylulose-5-phosphate synthase [Campylobacteraceae bacterium]